MAYLRFCYAYVHGNNIEDRKWYRNRIYWINMIAAIFSLIISLIVVFFVYVISKNSYFEINLARGLVWPLLLYRELVLILLPLFLVQFHGVEYFGDVIYKLKDEDAFFISLIVLYSVFVFALTFIFTSKALPIKFGQDEVKRVIDVDAFAVRDFANAALVSAAMLLFFSMTFLDYKHAFISSIFSGENLIEIRLGNVYASKLPTQISYIIMLASQVGSVYVAFLIYNKKYIKSALYIMCVVYLASAAGDKAPIFMCLILISFSFLSIRGANISAGKILYGIFCYSPLFYFAVYFVVSIQIDDLTVVEFNRYLINRLGVGQMAGVFETFSMPRLEGEFYWHMIPFASQFVEYPIYDKVLMMVIENFEFNEMGVKNSLFISEAFGIGGWVLVIFSPIVVGLSYGVGIKLLSTFLSNFFGAAVSVVYTLPIYLLSSHLTGGFSSFPFFKGLILNIISFVPIWFVYKMIGSSSRRGVKVYI